MLIYYLKPLYANEEEVAGDHHFYILRILGNILEVSFQDYLDCLYGFCSALKVTTVRINLHQSRGRGTLCDPNCGLFAIHVENQIPRIGIFAIKQINIGDELSYDYGGKKSFLVSFNS